MGFTHFLSTLKCQTGCFSNFILEDDKIICSQCRTSYPLHDDILCMVGPIEDSSLKKEIIHFWGGGWAKRGKEDVSIISKERFLQEIGADRLLLSIGKAEQVCEMSSLGLSGKDILEVGCGAGTSSILFALEGARIVASDLTMDACKITSNKFKLLGLSDCRAVQADAENLPFCDNVFDIVFSSGVLHHTPETQKAIDEIFRVLKPGGHAVVMLYAKWSFQYVVSLLLVRGILLGGLFRYGLRKWLGRVTEANWHTNTKQLNPLTKVYSGRQMRAFFKKFEMVSLRKNSFCWADIFPGMYRIIPRRKLRMGDTNRIIPSNWEVAIGRVGGFCLVVHTKKPL